MMGGGWAMGWMWVWPALIVVGLVVIGYVVVRWMQGGQRASQAGPGPGSLSARRILDERYARGEIDDEEYQRRRDLLP
jgi:putative membrane protein